MQIAVVAVGRLRPFFREACDEYLRRLRRFATATEHEVREASRASSVATARREEAKQLRAQLPAGATVVALARNGEGWSSSELARRLDGWRTAARPVAFIIGGSHGLDDSLPGGAGTRWSLGPLTLPHELARVVVLEQIYRAWTILAGQPYHKGR